MDDANETTWDNIKKSLAEALEKDADRIAHDELHIRESVQPLGKIVSEKEQEKLNSIGASLRAEVEHLRKTAAELRQSEIACN